MADRRWGVLVALGLVALTGVFLFQGMDEGNSAYLWDRRWPRLVAVLVVGSGLTWGALVLQGALQNRIVTPSLLGLDRLYLLLNSALVWAGVGTLWGGPIAFLVSTLVLTGFAGGLVRGLVTGTGGSAPGLLLAGLICGLLFSSLQSAVARVLSPTEFSLVQDLGAASLRTVEPVTALLAALVVAGAMGLVSREVRSLDVAALGRDPGRILGVDWDRSVGRLFLASAAVTAAATALAGPLAFFGLVAANLTRQLVGSEVHRKLLPIGLTLGPLLLLTAVLVTERALGLTFPWGVVVDAIGGVWLVWLLVKESRR